MSLFSSSFQMIVSKSSDNDRASLSSLSRLHGTLTPKIVATISLAIAGIVTSRRRKVSMNSKSDGAIFLVKKMRNWMWKSFILLANSGLLPNLTVEDKLVN